MKRSLTSESATAKAKLQALRADVDAALAQIAAKHGLPRLQLGSASYDPAGPFTFKLDGILPGGVSKDERLYDMTQAQPWTALPPRGTALVDGSRTLTVKGMRGSKVLCTMSDREPGKLYLFPTEHIKRCWVKANPQAAERVAASFRDALTEVPK